MQQSKIFESTAPAKHHYGQIRLEQPVNGRNNLDQNNMYPKIKHNLTNSAGNLNNIMSSVESLKNAPTVQRSNHNRSNSTIPKGVNNEIRIPNSKQPRLSKETLNQYIQAEKKARKSGKTSKLFKLGGSALESTDSTKILQIKPHNIIKANTVSSP